MPAKNTVKRAATSTRIRVTNPTTLMRRLRGARNTMKGPTVMRRLKGVMADNNHTKVRVNSFLT